MREVGMIITRDNEVLTTIFGSYDRVDFPVEYGTRMNRKFPGLVETLAHTHPPGVTVMSDEDRTTLMAWTMALAPYRVNMDVLCKTNGNVTWMRYWYELEALEDWRNRKDLERKERTMVLKSVNWDRYVNSQPWVSRLLEYSYELEDKS